MVVYLLGWDLGQEHELCLDYLMVVYLQVELVLVLEQLDFLLLGYFVVVLGWEQCDLVDLELVAVLDFVVAMVEILY